MKVMTRRRLDDEELFRRFSSYLIDELGRSPATARGYTGAVRRAGLLLQMPAWKITANDLRGLLRTHEGYGPSTKRALVVAFRQFHLWGHMEGLWKLDGLATLRTPSVPKNKRSPMNEEQARTVLSACVTSIQTRVTYLGLYAGLRIQESTGVNEKTWVRDKLVIIGKGQKKRIIPVHPELAKNRDLILSHAPSSKTSAGVIFGRLRDRLGLVDIEGKPATPHTLRRTFATGLYASGVSWEIVQALLGHEGGVTGDHYVSIGEHVLKTAIETLEYTKGIPFQMTLDGQAMPPVAVDHPRTWSLPIWHGFESVLDDVRTPVVCG